MEIIGPHDDLFSDWYDDSCALYFDSGVYQIFQDASDEQPGGTNIALSDPVTANHDFYHDRILSESAK